MVYTTEKTVAESKDKLSADEIRSTEEALTTAKDALKSTDMDRIKQATDNLTKTSHHLAETLYKKTSQSAPGQEQGGAPGGQKRDDDVVDAEFEDVRK